jgi:4-amino-4-deoxy-L-arabinose transferase-like glycosyltransferase
MTSQPSTKFDAREPVVEVRGISPEKYFRLVVLVFALNLLSASLFIAFINRPVYDDEYNIVDVHNYAQHGLTAASLRAHTNAPGPASYIWMATVVRLLHGNELRDARIGSALSWVLLVCGTLAFVRYGAHSQEWCAAMLVLLVFPHAVEATATVLTEGPALLFAVLGAIAWIEFSASENATPDTIALGLLGGLSMGIAIISRQYFLALLPAAAVLAIWEMRSSNPRRSWLWIIGALVSMALAVPPALLLVMIWKGATSPGMATGISYTNWQVRLGANFFRPVTALIYCAVYLVPLTFPLMLPLNASRRWREIGIAILAGAAAGRFHAQTLQPGPLRSAFYAIARGPFMTAVMFGLLVAIAAFSALTIARTLWEKRGELLTRPAVVFAVLMVLFFLGEQVGVGGNGPFYDRYMLQIAPFLGIISFAALPQLSFERLGMLGAMSVLNQVILWRYAFTS